MTKERKAAIKQWQTVKERIKQTGIFAKPFNEYDWFCNCWFCQYVRENHTPCPDNGCSKCPLWKWANAHYKSIKKTDCGCSHKKFFYTTLYHIVGDESQRLKKRIEACDLIIEALKGEHIWEE